jgi:hypothetical protein
MSRIFSASLQPSLFPDHHTSTSNKRSHKHSGKCIFLSVPQLNNVPTAVPHQWPVIARLPNHFLLFYAYTDEESARGLLNDSFFLVIFKPSCYGFH